MEIKRMKRILSRKCLPLGIALMQWLISCTLRFDRLFFEYTQINGTQILVKTLYLVFLILSWMFLFHVIREIKSGNESYGRGFFYFVIYFTLTTILIIIVWPGTWFWDDIITLLTIQSYQLDVWHHLLTGLYQAVLLQILPFPGGMLILQNAIISVCVAYIIVQLENLFALKKNKNPASLFIKLIPFLLPPVLAYQFSGFRLGIYSYVELLYLVVFISLIMRKKEWSAQNLVAVGFLCVLTAAWRTESAFYVPLTCGVLICIKPSFLNIRKKVLCCVFMVVGFSFLYTWQKAELENDDYVIVSLVNPCTELVRAADPKENDLQLSKINKVLNLEVIHDNPRMTGEKMYWYNGLIKNGYSRQEYHDFLEGMASLALKYPKVVWADRWNTFLKSVELSEKTNTNLYDAFDPAMKNEMMEQAKMQNWFAFYPLFVKERKALIFLWRGYDVNGIIMPYCMRLVWNAIIPMLLIIYAWIKLLLQKKYLLFIFISAFVVKIPIIFLMEPEGYFLYFLSFYLVGYVYGCFKLLSFMEGVKKKPAQID